MYIYICTIILIHMRTLKYPSICIYIYVYIYICVYVHIVHKHEACGGLLSSWYEQKLRVSDPRVRPLRGGQDPKPKQGGPVASMLLCNVS